MPVKPHAFVAMPFGLKTTPDGQTINFDRIYADLLRPAVEAAGMEILRADEEQRAGDIRADMFQELLIADLVLADLTLDNPNVWYELGVRHALRARGVVLVSGSRTTAFDLYTDRKLRYTLKDGTPDPATLESDRNKLTDLVTATMDSWHGRKISPVYNLLPNLQEPDWKSLRIGDVREFWSQHDEWEHRIEVARTTGRIGDVLVFADEAPVAAFRAEAAFKAGEALRRAEQYTLALEQLERGLDIEPRHLKSQREKGICLQRLAATEVPGYTLALAREHYRAMLRDNPRDSETWALLGRIDKDFWTAAWRRSEFNAEQKRDEAAYEDAPLRAAIESYSRAYRAAPNHYYSGINALTLMHLHRHLTSDARYDRDMAMMSGAVRFAAESELAPQRLFWSKATLGDLEVLVGTPDTVTSAYKEAIVRSENDWFALNSVRAQLELLQALGFSREIVAAGMATFDRAMRKLRKPDGDWSPKQILLFSGHMIDAPERASPRFPATKEVSAAQQITHALDAFGAGPEDLALCQAAAGGDLLFLEACQQRGVRCRVHLPFAEAEFIQRSILPSTGGVAWSQRFEAVKAALKDSVRIMPDELGPLPKGIDPFERCNLWLLYSALALGVDKVRFICLWDAAGGDGPGGTAHMFNEVKRRTGRVVWIDSRTI